MKAELRIKLNVDNAAFEDFPMSEVVHIVDDAGAMQKYANIVGEAKNNPCPSTRSFDLQDSNGNTVGQYTIQISEVD